MTNPPSTGLAAVLQRPRWYTGRGELVMVIGTIALAGLVAWGAATMEVPEDSAFPGPEFFPWIVAVFLAVLGVWLGVDVLRSARRVHLSGEAHELSPEMLEDLGRLDETTEIRTVDPESQVGRHDAAEQAERGRGVDVKTVLLTLAGLAVFAVILPVVGWIVSGAALFWHIARVFGSRRPLLDVGIAVIVSSLVQLAFGAGLGLSLPGGFLEGAFSWIS